MKRVLVLSIVLAVATPEVDAGKFNEVLDIGAVAPAWVHMPGVDGKKHSLADFKNKELVVVVFMCNSCPAVQDYEERMLAFTKKYSGPDGKVGFVGINVNKIPEDSLAKMKERAKERNFDFPYLFDGTQKIAKQYGALYTPEFFVLDKERKVAYMGAMDDRDSAKLAKIHYLDQAVSALLKGEKPAITETRGRGCRVRYLRSRDE